MTYLRVSLAAMALLGGIFATHSFRPKVAAAPHWPLREFPSNIGLSHGEDRPFETQVVRAVGADDYINRVYLGSTPPIELYVGYYKDQRSGDRIHSPKNCLPGAGWEPIRSGYISVPMNGKTVAVNEYVIQRDRDKLMVFYWYQGRGRVIAGEYSGKFWMVADAISRNRTDGALVRLMTPMKDSESEAQSRLVSFTQALVPYLNQFIPK